MYEGERKLYINPGECIGGGACQPACPVDAIKSRRPGSFPKGAVPAAQSACRMSDGWCASGVTSIAM